jgi:hypothetical protein
MVELEMEAFHVLFIELVLLLVFAAGSFRWCEMVVAEDFCDSVGVSILPRSLIFEAEQLRSSNWFSYQNIKTGILLLFIFFLFPPFV